VVGRAGVVVTLLELCCYVCCLHSMYTDANLFTCGGMGLYLTCQRCPHT
jgi:hypothetical protein